MCTKLLQAGLQAGLRIRQYESPCFLTESVPVDCESHQPMKLTDVRYNRLLLDCNKEVLMWLGSSFLCNQMGCLLPASGVMITWL